MTMRASEVLDTLNAAGIQLSPAPRPGVIRAGPRNALTDEYRTLIRAHKPELLALLTRRPIPVPALTGADRAAVEEALDERSAMREFEGGEARAVAETEARKAMRIYRVLLALPDERASRWLTMLAPDCELAEATRAAGLRFGPERVLAVVEHSARQIDSEHCPGVGLEA